MKIAPSTAKNCLSVGAAYATTDEYTRYDPNVSATLYNHDNLGYFSARGPTFDNRFKPDIVAPGVKIWSARSYIPFCDASGLIQKTGTSMACPGKFLYIHLINLIHFSCFWSFCTSQRIFPSK